MSIVFLHLVTMRFDTPFHGQRNRKCCAPQAHFTGLLQLPTQVVVPPKDRLAPVQKVSVAGGRYALKDEIFADARKKGEKEKEEKAKAKKNKSAKKAKTPDK